MRITAPDSVNLDVGNSIFESNECEAPDAAINARWDPVVLDTFVGGERELNTILPIQTALLGGGGGLSVLKTEQGLWPKQST